MPKTLFGIYRHLLYVLLTIFEKLLFFFRGNLLLKDAKVKNDYCRYCVLYPVTLFTASMFTNCLQGMLIVNVKLRLILLEIICVQIIELFVLTEI